MSFCVFCDTLGKHRNKLLLIVASIPHWTAPNKSKSTAEQGGYTDVQLAGPRQQNLISISDLLDLKSVQKQFCSLFLCQYDYGFKI